MKMKKILSDEEKEDLGLLLLMQQSDRTQVVSREEVMNSLDCSHNSQAAPERPTHIF